MKFKHIKINEELTITPLITEKQYGTSQRNVPVSNISWHEAHAFAEKHGHRLITSDEYDVIVKKLPELLFSCMHEWTSTKDGSNRVFRGGSWTYDEDRARSAIRFIIIPDNRDFFIGLRLALVQEGG
jgi:formylglycine-generating enzyme required for sulfatase activity